ncbi:hypothetical protein Taro_033594 [Colocasia esculenta]|uniref:Uncharacterized protein n=1 Tax=Colocasia esculenta TaxID=4460 RepID=A0A843VP50_COLES|nr:hypothetical protein [Colocasia esculenta]
MSCPPAAPAAFHEHYFTLVSFSRKHSFARDPGESGKQRAEFVGSWWCSWIAAGAMGGIGIRDRTDRVEGCSLLSEEKLLRICPQLSTVQVSPSVGPWGALSAIGISGDHCGPFVSGRRCSQRPQYRHRRCRKGVLGGVRMGVAASPLPCRAPTSSLAVSIY